MLGFECSSVSESRGELRGGSGERRKERRETHLPDHVDASVLPPHLDIGNVGVCFHHNADIVHQHDNGELWHEEIREGEFRGPIGEVDKEFMFVEEVQHEGNHSDT